MRRSTVRVEPVASALGTRANVRRKTGALVPHAVCRDSPSDGIGAAVRTESLGLRSSLLVRRTGRRPRARSAAGVRGAEGRSDAGGVCADGQKSLLQHRRTPQRGIANRNRISPYLKRRGTIQRQVALARPAYGRGLITCARVSVQPERPEPRGIPSRSGSPRSRCTPRPRGPATGGPGARGRVRWRLRLPGNRSR